MDAAEDTDDSDNDARNNPEYNHWGCEKCGMKLSTLKELAEHKDTHKKYACPKCRTRFTSNYLADKHELTCTNALSTDVFEASRTRDPLMVVMNSLGQLVNTLSEAGAIDDDITGIMKDQLKKAKHNHSTQETYEKNHQTQRTWTFLKPPTFTPGNVVTSYMDRDITELKGKEFRGDAEPEDNYTSLQALTTAISRIVRSKLITKDVATDLLILHLRGPAMDMVHDFRERFEQKHGEAVPEYEDVLLFLERKYIRIKPDHAKEQLNTMAKSESESLADFFIRAWRCSHFASFTEEEQDRYKFRNDAVKAAMMRNLGAAKRKLVEDEELKRKMTGKEPMEPPEIVDLIDKQQSSKIGQDSTRNRPDYSLVGELTPAYVKRVEDRITGQEDQIVEAEEPEEEKEASYEEDRDPNWTSEAIREIGDGCFKCGRRGHRARKCFTYVELTSERCNLCNKGFHSEQECTTRRQTTWSGQFLQDNEEEISTGDDNWEEPHVTEQWPEQRENQSSQDSHGPVRSRRKGKPRRGLTRSQEARNGPGYSPWGQPARERNKRGGYYRFRDSTMGSEDRDQADMDTRAVHHWY